MGTFAAGASWVTVLSCLSTGTQSAAPAWVRARAVATNLVTNQASLALGSVLWGIVATHSNTRIALGASVVLMVALLALNRDVRVGLPRRGRHAGCEIRPTFHSRSSRRRTMARC